jgi:hypothetical protein
MLQARKIMKYSKPGLSTMFMPKRGNEVRISGRMAQCMAQANEVAIPIASQLILIRMAQN